MSFPLHSFLPFRAPLSDSLCISSARYAVQQALRNRSSTLLLKDVEQARISMPEDASSEVEVEGEEEVELVAVMARRDGRYLAFSQV